MILLCCGEISDRHFDALCLFALQLDRRGHQVAIDQRFLPEEITKQTRFEIAPFLADPDDVSPRHLIVVGANQISEEVQTLLGALRFDPIPAIWVVGDFEDLQTELSARNKVAYATGHEPQIMDVAAPRWSGFQAGAITPLFTEIQKQPNQSDGKQTRVLVYLPCEEIEEDEAIIGQLCVLNYSPKTTWHVLTNAKGKNTIRKSRHTELSVFSYNELPPTELLHYFDVLVCFGTNVPGERMAVLALNAMGEGKVVIDCTETMAFAQDGAPVLKGPSHAAALPGYLQETVLRNRFEVGQRIQQADWLKQFDIALLERALGLPIPKEATDERQPQTLFLPTNGNGLGHAQRCALIAEAASKDLPVSFAAFPSCVGLLQNRGFTCTPVVARSGAHAEEYAADLANYLRLRNTVRAGDQLVFDGGYVFESVYRIITQLKLAAVWIRRGLWRPSQITSNALERARAFSKIIVPMEAFEELNTDYSTGKNIHKVGPIVQKTRLGDDAVADLCDRLSLQFKRPFETLVVTMLGGGVASERTAQMQLLCSLMEQRTDSLHLMIVWPDAFVSSTLYGWQNSHVVQTSHATDLCQAADLCISAAGYNSFHELLYAQVPTIFIPQSAPFLDDQERRARAALDRGLAGFAQESELLHLERELEAFLDLGKSEDVRSALAAQTLPDRGNAAAARLIEEGGR